MGAGITTGHTNQQSQGRPRLCATARVALVGDTKTGKTSMVQNLCNVTNHSLNTSYSSELYLWKATLDDRNLHVYMRDACTSTTERRPLHELHLTNHYIIMYSVTDRHSYDVGVVQWLQEIRELGPNNILLLGNKCDRIDERRVSYYEAKNFADDNRLDYFEVSAKNGTNLELAVLHFIQRGLHWRKITVPRYNRSLGYGHISK